MTKQALFGPWYPMVGVVPWANNTLMRVSSLRTIIQHQGPAKTRLNWLLTIIERHANHNVRPVQVGGEGNMYDG